MSETKIEKHIWEEYGLFYFILKEREDQNRKNRT